MNIEEILSGLRAERDRLDSAIAALGGAGVRGRRRRPKISAEGRRRISEAMKKRWAARRKNKAAAA